MLCRPVADQENLRWLPDIGPADHRSGWLRGLGRLCEFGAGLIFGSIAHHVPVEALAGSANAPLTTVQRRVQHLVHEGVCGGVLRPWDPRVGDKGRVVSVAGTQGEGANVVALDLPSPGHLLDDEFRVQADVDAGIRIDGVHILQPGDSAAILGEVIRLVVEEFGNLHDYVAGGVAD